MLKLYSWLIPAYKNIISLNDMKFNYYVLLIHTLPGIGNKLLIKNIILYLMCQKNTGCGTCNNCELVISKNHPDIYFLDLQTIGIDDIRYIIEKINTFSQQNGKKIIYMNIDKLTEFASNALLKTLEESPKNSWFLFITYNQKKLLPTLVSRCTKLYLSPPTEQIGLHWLKTQFNNQIKEEICLTALRISYLAPLSALELIKNQWSKRILFFQSFNDSFENNLLSLLQLLNNDSIIFYMNWMCSIFLDSIKLHNKLNTFITNIDQIKLIIKISERISLSNLMIILEKLFICHNDLLICNLTCNRELIILEQLLFLDRIKGDSRGIF